MKKKKLLLALAMVIVALTFSFNAKAQGNVPVWLNYSVSWPNSFHEFSFTLYMYNLDTQESYTLETSQAWNMIDQTTYDLGNVPAGRYQINLMMSSYTNDAHFDWNANGQSGSVFLVSNNHSLLTEEIVLGDYGGQATPGIELRLQKF